MTEKYEVTATKKYGTTYHGRMTTKEPGTTNGLISIAGTDGSRTLSHRMKSATSDTFRWLRINSKESAWLKDQTGRFTELARCHSGKLRHSMIYQ